MTTYIPSLTLPSFIFESAAASILLPVCAGAAIGYSTRHRTKPTYTRLRPPPFAPPPSLFGPAWTALYALMGYAAHRAWTLGHSPSTTLLSPTAAIAATRHGATLYTLQLALNLVWMPLFFGFGRPLAATVDIVALTGTVGYLAKVWGGVDATSAWLLVPYLGWLGYATYLCVGAGWLNGWRVERGEGGKVE